MVFPNPPPTFNFYDLIPLTQNSDSNGQEIRRFIANGQVDTVDNGNGIVLIEFPSWDPPATPPTVPYSGSTLPIEITKGIKMEIGQYAWGLNEVTGYNNAFVYASDHWD